MRFMIRVALECEVESKRLQEINHFTILSALFQSDFYVFLMFLCEREGVGAMEIWNVQHKT